VVWAALLQVVVIWVVAVWAALLLVALLNVWDLLREELLLLVMIPKHNDLHQFNALF